jgi:hypothetical protein
MFKNKFTLFLLVLGLVALGTFTQFKKQSKTKKVTVTESKLPVISETKNDSVATSSEIIQKATGKEEKTERAAALRKFQNGKLYCSPLDGRDFCSLFDVPLDFKYGVIVKEKSKDTPNKTIAVRAIANEAFEKAKEVMSYYPNANAQENGFVALNFFLEKSLNKEIIQGLDDYAIQILIEETIGQETKTSFYIYLPPGVISNLLNYYKKNFENFRSTKDFKFFQNAREAFRYGILRENFIKTPQQK